MTLLATGAVRSLQLPSVIVAAPFVPTVSFDVAAPVIVPSLKDRATGLVVTVIVPVGVALAMLTYVTAPGPNSLS
jgi:hypothetical protein